MPAGRRGRAEAVEHEVRPADQGLQAVGRVGDRRRARPGPVAGSAVAAVTRSSAAREERGDEAVDRRQRRLGAGHDGAQHRGVDPLHRELGGDDDPDLLDRIELVVEDLDLGPLAGEHAVQRIRRKDHDDVELAVLEALSGRRLVGGEALGVDEALEHVLVLGDGVFVERRGWTDEQRPQLELLAAVADAEQQQHEERPEDEQGHEPRLAGDLDELLAHEGEALDDRRPGAVHRGAGATTS